MKKITIAFDIDGTLISNVDDSPNIKILTLFRILASMKNTRLIIWSGGGVDYAELWARRLRLGNATWKVCCKCPETAALVDIAIDDQHEFDMAGINLIVREK